MSRDLPAPLAAAIDEPVLNPFLALRLETPDPVYVWTGVGTITFNNSDGVSKDWLGAGDLGALEAVGESTDGSATGIRAVLHKIPAEFADYLSEEPVRGAKLEVYIGVLNETYQVVDAAKLLNRYRLDQYKITDGGSTLSVEIVGESRAIDARRPAVKRFTDEYQQRINPGDKFFEYVSRMTEVSILWAKASQNATALGGNSVGGGNSGLFGASGFVSHR